MDEGPVGPFFYSLQVWCYQPATRLRYLNPYATVANSDGWVLSPLADIEIDVFSRVQACFKSEFFSFLNSLLNCDTIKVRLFLVCDSSMQRDIEEAHWLCIERLISSLQIPCTSDNHSQSWCSTASIKDELSACILWSLAADCFSTYLSLANKNSFHVDQHFAMMNAIVEDFRTQRLSPNPLLGLYIEINCLHETWNFQKLTTSPTTHHKFCWTRGSLSHQMCE